MSKEILELCSGLVKIATCKAPVIDNSYGVWWVCCTTGQAISMGEVINSVYKDIMEDRELPRH